MGLFADLPQFKTSLHVHTALSDGNATVATMIEQYYSRDYDFLAITDHNQMMQHWTIGPNGLSLQRFNDIAAGVGRGNRPMTMIAQTVEQSNDNDHINTFFMDYRNAADIEDYLGRLPNYDALAHFNHIGRYVNSANIDNPVRINRYAEIMMRHPRCLGVEIVNKQDLYVNDRRFWDNINRAMIKAKGRVVWGFSNDDAHSTGEVGWSFNMMVMPERSIPALKTAMQAGQFYAVARYARPEGVLNGNRDTPTPVIRDIDVSEDEITIRAENYDRIVWIGDDSQPIPGYDETIYLKRFKGWFVRANVIGFGGVAFTQPFVIERRVPVVEVLARMHVPVVPIDGDEVARKADLFGLGGVGFFSFDQEDGNLYFIADPGVRDDMFQYDDDTGNFYYVLPSEEDV